MMAKEVGVPEPCVFVAWMVTAELEYSKKNLLPLEDVRIVDECGYIFEGSTNQMKYI